MAAENASADNEAFPLSFPPWMDDWCSSNQSPPPPQSALFFVSDLRLPQDVVIAILGRSNSMPDSFLLRAPLLSHGRCTEMNFLSGLQPSCNSRVSLGPNIFIHSAVYFCLPSSGNTSRRETAAPSGRGECWEASFGAKQQLLQAECDGFGGGGRAGRLGSPTAGSV